MILAIAERVASARRKLAREERGFTLVELLIVIVILGILAAIVVIAVRGISNRGQQEACNADERAIESAEEAAFAQTGAYMSEANLVSSGFLRAQSSLWNVNLGGATGYTLVAQDPDCA